MSCVGYGYCAEMFTSGNLPPYAIEIKNVLCCIFRTWFSRRDNFVLNHMLYLRILNLIEVENWYENENCSNTSQPVDACVTRGHSFSSVACVSNLNTAFKRSVTNAIVNIEGWMCVVCNVRAVRNAEVGCLWKGAIVPCFKVLCCDFPGGTAENRTVRQSV